MADKRDITLNEVLLIGALALMSFCLYQVYQISQVVARMQERDDFQDYRLDKLESANAAVPFDLTPSREPGDALLDIRADADRAIHPRRNRNV